MNVLDSDYISNILEINGNYYGVAFTTNTMEKEIHIYYVDAENKTVELYTEEKICFDYYWKAEIRKNRIYLIKHEGNETAYIYFDIDTKKFSDVKIFKTEDIIKGK